MYQKESIAKSASEDFFDRKLKDQEATLKKRSITVVPRILHCYRSVAVKAIIDPNFKMLKGDRKSHCHYFQ